MVYGIRLKPINFPTNTCYSLDLPTLDNVYVIRIHTLTGVCKRKVVKGR